MSRQPLTFIVIFFVVYCFFGGQVFRSSAPEKLLVTNSSQNICLINCKTLLKQLQLPFTAMLIDIEILKDIEAETCETPLFNKGKVRIAVSVEFSKSIKTRDYQYFDITLYEIAKGRNYIKFFGEKTRAIPLISLYSIGNWSIPENLSLFAEYWHRSPMIDCLGLKMNRNDSTPYLPIVQSLEAMSSLSKLLVSLKMHPYLNGGTLLGWYRECSIIPHTRDLDIAVSIDDYNPKLLEMLRGNDSDFFLYRTLGRPNDTFEITVQPRKKSKIKIDIFFMYSNGRNESWVGGTGGNGQKYRYVYPLYDPYCSADLMGHLFWVSCRPDVMLETEYGKGYKKDHPTKNFSWNTSHNNIKLAGKWSTKEMKEVYKEYG